MSLYFSRGCLVGDWELRCFDFFNLSLLLLRRHGRSLTDTGSEIGMWEASSTLRRDVAPRLCVRVILSRAVLTFGKNFESV